MNPIARMMKRYINMPLKKALPLLFIGALVLVATTGCTTSTTTQNASGGGSGNSGVAVAINSQQTASQIGSGYLTDAPKAGDVFLIYDVTVTNINQNNQDIGNPYYFKLSTAGGTVYEIASRYISRRQGSQCGVKYESRREGNRADSIRGSAERESDVFDIQ